MRNVAVLVFTLLILVAPSSVSAQEMLTHVRIETDDTRAVAASLTDSGFAVLEGTILEGSLELVVSSAELATLRAMGHAPIVIPPTVSRVGTGGTSHADVVAEMTAAAAAFPAISQLVDLTDAYGMPTTFEGRHIYAVRISDNVLVDEDEPAALVVSAHHGNEVKTPLVALYAIEQLTTLYGSDATITALVDEYEIWIAPVWSCANVDNCPGIEFCNPGTGLCEAPVADPLPILAGDEWHYFKGVQEPSPGNLTDWTAPGFDHSAWSSGDSGFGYGVDCGHGTTLADMQDTYASVYLRRTFTVEDPAVIDTLTLTMDYDDGFVAYVNGIEVARNNVLGTPPTHATTAQADHECSGAASGANSPESFELHLGFDLNALLQPGVNVLAIQGHNLTLDSSDFTQIPTLVAVLSPPCLDPLECADGDPCTVDECVVGECVNTAVVCPAGEACNSGTGECELQITVAFQDGEGAYSGTVDTFVQEDPSAADNDNSAFESLNWDLDDPLGSGFSTMTLLRFDAILGGGAGQVPLGASIRSATLRYAVGGDSNAPGDDGNLHEMLVPWAGTVSWNALGSSPGATAGEDYAPSVVAVVPGTPAGIEALDLELRYDPDQVSIVAVSAAALGEAFSLNAHDQDGVYGVSMYGLAPIGGSGGLLSVTIEALRDSGPIAPIEVTGQANEGKIPLRFDTRR